MPEVINVSQKSLFLFLFLQVQQTSERMDAKVRYVRGARTSAQTQRSERTHRGTGFHFFKHEEDERINERVSERAKHTEKEMGGGMDEHPTLWPGGGGETRGQHPYAGCAPHPEPRAARITLGTTTNPGNPTSLAITLVTLCFRVFLGVLSGRTRATPAKSLRSPSPCVFFCTCRTHACVCGVFLFFFPVPNSLHSGPRYAS